MARLELITSMTQLEELRRASRYPKLKAILPAHRIGTMINNLQRAFVLNDLPPLPDGIEATDPNDGFLLAMALAAEADYLVTGDRRAGLLQQVSLGRTRIIPPTISCSETLKIMASIASMGLDVAAPTLPRLGGEGGTRIAKTNQDG